MRLVSLFMSVLAMASWSGPIFGEGVLYGFSAGAPSAVIAIDTSNGSSFIVGSTGGVGGSGVAHEPNNDVWYTSTFGGLYTFDIVTGQTTLVGTYGVTAKLRGLAFDATFSTLYSVGNDKNLYTVNTATGAASPVGNLGLGPVTIYDLATDSAGTLWAVDSGGSIYTIDTSTPNATLVAEKVDARGISAISFDPADNLYGVTDDQDMLVLINTTSGTTSDVGGPLAGEYIGGMDFNRSAEFAAGTLHIKVTKKFADDRDDDVEVTLTCNSGLPLSQSFTIAGGDEDGVTFIVTELPDGGVDCEVTESGGPDGYSATFNGSDDGCQWTGVTGGTYACVITNTPGEVTYTVEKDWDFAADETFERVAQVAVTCENVAVGDFSFGSYTNEIELTGNDDWSLDFHADPEGGSRCKAVETVEDSAIESDQGCADWTYFDVGDGERTCTITNTVFFEGIPTLSRYGLAVLALLMLSIGFIGLRRFA